MRADRAVTGNPAASDAAVSKLVSELAIGGAWVTVDVEIDSGAAYGSAIELSEATAPDQFRVSILLTGQPVAPGRAQSRDHQDCRENTHRSGALCLSDANLTGFRESWRSIAYSGNAVVAFTSSRTA